MTTVEDLTLIEQAGRRCSSCHTGRNWRRLEVLRPEAGAPVVTCPACKPRLMALAAKPAPAPEKAPAPAKAPAKAPAVAAVAAEQPRRAQRAPSQPREDRLKRALRTLPAGTHSTGRIAKAAGLNEAKVLSRLRALEADGEVQRVGKRWSTERPSSDLEAAFDRLQARASNLRIIRPGQPVG